MKEAWGNAETMMKWKQYIGCECDAVIYVTSGDGALAAVDAGACRPQNLADRHKRDVEKAIHKMGLGTISKFCSTAYNFIDNKEQTDFEHTPSGLFGNLYTTLNTGFEFAADHANVDNDDEGIKHAFLKFSKLMLNKFAKDLNENARHQMAGYHDAITRARHFLGLITVRKEESHYTEFVRQLRY